MLSAHTIATLSSLRYQCDAKLLVSWMPLGGIYWDDEMPNCRDLFRLFDDDERNHVLRAFGVRVLLWKREDLSVADREFWDQLRAEVPDWALFRRLTVTAEQLQIQVEAEESSDVIFHALTDGADELTVTERNGVQTFSARFDISKDAAPEPEAPKSEFPSLWYSFLAKFWP